MYQYLYLYNLSEMNYLVHGYNKRKLGLVHNAAGIQHVGHEGHGIYAARCVHYIHHDGRKGGGLKHVTTHWIRILLYQHVLWNQ